MRSIVDLHICAGPWYPIVSSFGRDCTILSFRLQGSQSRMKWLPRACLPVWFPISCLRTHVSRVILYSAPSLYPPTFPFVSFIMNISIFQPQSTVTSKLLVPQPAQFLPGYDVLDQRKLPPQHQSYCLPDAYFPPIGPRPPSGGNNFLFSRFQDSSKTLHGSQNWGIANDAEEIAQPQHSSVTKSANLYTAPYFFLPPSNPHLAFPSMIYGRMASPPSRHRTTQACTNCRKRKTKVRYRAQICVSWLMNGMDEVLREAPCMSALPCSWSHLSLCNAFEPKHEAAKQSTCGPLLSHHGCLCSRHEGFYYASGSCYRCSAAHPPSNDHSYAEHHSGSNFAQMDLTDEFNVVRCRQCRTPRGHSLFPWFDWCIYEANFVNHA